MAKRFLLGLVIVLLIAGAYYGITLRSIHTYQLEYAGLPKTDVDLQTWLGLQSGIRDAQIQRNEQMLFMHFTTPWWQSSPTTADVMGHAEASGYKDRRGFTFNRHPLWW